MTPSKLERAEALVVVRVLEAAVAAARLGTIICALTMIEADCTVILMFCDSTPSNCSASLMAKALESNELASPARLKLAWTMGR